NDTNKVCSAITADVSIVRALDESDITDYVLYWGSNATTKIGQPIAVLAKTGMNLTHSLTNGSRPGTASHLLVFTKNSAGENATPIAVAISELGQTIIQDVSAGQGTYSGQAPSIAIDAANGKVLIVTSNAANAAKPALFRCGLDGTSCTYSDISAGQAVSIGDPVALVDSANNKLI